MAKIQQNWILKRGLTHFFASGKTSIGSKRRADITPSLKEIASKSAAASKPLINQWLSVVCKHFLRKLRTLGLMQNLKYHLSRILPEVARKNGCQRKGKDISTPQTLPCWPNSLHRLYSGQEYFSP